MKQWVVVNSLGVIQSENSWETSRACVKEFCEGGGTWEHFKRMGYRCVLLSQSVIAQRKIPAITDWDETAEEGDVVMYRGEICKLTVSNGRNKRDAGILTPIKAK